MQDDATGFERIASGVYLEGLAVDHERNAIWYSDVIGGGIHGVTPEGEALASFNRDRMWTGGILMNRDGSVLSSGEGGIMWNNPKTGGSGWLLRELEGKPINGINEMVPDGTGGIFFGTNDIEMVIQAQATRPTALYRLTGQGDVIKLADEINFSNGLMYDADRRRLYCNDTFVCTWAFDVEDDLTLTNKRVLLEKEDADGMALDALGNVWVTGFRSNHIERISSDGNRLDPVRVPPGSVTQLRFGGPDLRSFYLNSVPADGGDSLKDGVPLSQHNSHLYRGRSDQAGMKVGPADFDLG